MDATTVLLAALLVALVFFTVILSRRLRETSRALLGLREEVQSLRVTSRTRVSTLVADTPESKEIRTLRRLGRASVGRRVVVGGDDDSQLNRNLENGSLRGQG